MVCKTDPISPVLQPRYFLTCRFRKGQARCGILGICMWADRPLGAVRNSWPDAYSYVIWLFLLGNAMADTPLLVALRPLFMGDFEVL